MDVLYVLCPGAHLGWAINDPSDELEALLGRPVDLVAKSALHARLRGAGLAAARTGSCMRPEVHLAAEIGTASTRAADIASRHTAVIVEGSS